MASVGMERRLLISGALLVLAGLLLWWASPLDLAIHHAAALARQGWAARQALWFTALGGLVVMGPAALLAAGWLFRRRRGREALWLILTVASGRLMVEGMKLLVQRPRPPVAACSGAGRVSRPVRAAWRG